MELKNVRIWKSEHTSEWIEEGTPKLAGIQ